MTGHSRRPIPLPDTFVTCAPGKSNAYLRGLYTVGEATVSRWRKESGIVAPATVANKHHLPADFTEHVSASTHMELRRRYGVHHKTIQRWCAETGTKPARRYPEKPKRAPPVRTGYARSKKPGWGKKSVVEDRVVDTSLDGLSASFLRKFASCYRCDEKGHMSPKGKLWRYGNVILSAEEVIERAANRGFRRNRAFT